MQRKGNPLTLLVGMQTSTATMENSVEIPKKLEIELPYNSGFNAQYWILGAGALGQPRGMVWGGRREEGSGWGTHVYLWRIHFDIWQN